MVSPEDRRIRAALLARKYPESAQLLEFYIQLTLFQEDVARNLDPDVGRLAVWFPRLQALAPQINLPASFALRPSTDEGKFFWRVLMQPYAEHFRKTAEGTGSTCPSCGGKPVVGVLRGEGDGAKRALDLSFMPLGVAVPAR